jgi:hypothetical protein
MELISYLLSLKIDVYCTYRSEHTKPLYEQNENYLNVTPGAILSDHLASRPETSAHARVDWTYLAAVLH